MLRTTARDSRTAAGDIGQIAAHQHDIGGIKRIGTGTDRNTGSPARVRAGRR